MLTPLTAEACAHALIGAARPNDDDLPALLAGDLEELDPIGWRKWRCLAATALLSVGFDRGQVHRALLLTDTSCAGGVEGIPSEDGKQRARRAVQQLRAHDIWPRFEAVS
jgi:hypothetical protein